MKATLIILLVLLAACTPFRWVDKPVQMNHVVTFYDATEKPTGYVLCHDYSIVNDILVMDSAGYYPRLRHQRAVATMLIPNKFWKYTITSLYK